VKQLIVRVEPSLIRQLKLLAALHDISMAELVRRTLADEIATQRQDNAVKQALAAAGL
jgi:predicted HicB family RNase H-like nuclease